MSGDGPASFRMAILITLKLLRQRRPWILRGLTEKDRAKSDQADNDLANALMEGAGRFEITLKPFTARLHSTPPMTVTESSEARDEVSIKTPSANPK